MSLAFTAWRRICAMCARMLSWLVSGSDSGSDNASQGVRLLSRLVCVSDGGFDNRSESARFWPDLCKADGPPSRTFTTRPLEDSDDSRQRIANLNTLRFEGNDIGDAGALDLAHSLRHDTRRQRHLRILKLGNNSIRDSGVAEIVDALLATHNTALHELDLNNNLIGDAGAAALGRLLPEEELTYGATSRLTVLKLSKNAIGHEGVAAIANGLQTNRFLGILDLSHNPQIGDQGAVAMATRLTSRFLRVVNLAMCNIGPVGRTEMATALRHWNGWARIDMSSGETRVEDFLVADGTHEANTLCTQFASVRSMGASEVDIARLWKSQSARLEVAKIEYSPDLIDVAKVFETAGLSQPNCPLHTLCLGGHRYGWRSEDVSVLANVLMACRHSLRILDLTWSHIQDKPLAGIVEALWPQDDNSTSSNSPTLRELYLCRNCISSKGARCLGNALRRPGLEKLDLFGNCLGNEGAVCIGQALGETSFLQVLHLGHNGIGDEGAVALASGLEHNTSLRELSLRPIPAMGERGRTRLYTVALEHPNEVDVDAIVSEE